MLIVWGRRNSINVQKVMWAIGELGWSTFAMTSPARSAAPIPPNTSP